VILCYINDPVVLTVLLSFHRRITQVMGTYMYYQS